MDTIKMNAEEKTQYETYIKKYGAMKVDEIEEYLTKQSDNSFANFVTTLEKNEKEAEKLLLQINRIENGLRAVLSLEYGEVACSRRNYMYELSNSIGAHQNPLACDTPYPYFLESKGQVKDYIHATDFDGLVRCYLLLPQDKLIAHAFTPNATTAAGNLYALVRVKNTVNRGGSVIGGFGQGARYDGHGDCRIDGVVDNSLEKNQQNIAFILKNME